jgi:hypothetical protein
MTVIHSFVPGDFLIFQLESGYALLRVLDVEHVDDGAVWHVAAYRDLFLDVESANAAIEQPESLNVDISHAALTNRAFESTQVAWMKNIPLNPGELKDYEAWNLSDKKVSDRSIRLLLGLR